MRVIVLGATNNPKRYAYLAVQSLLSHGHKVFPVGIKKGEVEGLPIINHREIIEDIDIITVYVGLQNQKSLYDYILKTSPKKIIFNPGAENPELQRLAEEKGITVQNACTLVLLSIDTFNP